MKAELQFIFIVQKMEDSMLLQAMLMKAGYNKRKMTSVYRWFDGIQRARAYEGMCLLFMDKAFEKTEPDYSNIVRKEAEKRPIILVEEAVDNQAGDMLRLGVQEVLSLRELTSNYLEKAVQHAIERHHMRQQIRETALLDSLTGLYNRCGFMEKAEQAVAVSKRLGMSASMVFIDVDYMKWTNESFGHEEGDLLLVEVANLLRGVFRRTDVIGRLGGDEFAVLAMRKTEHAGKSPTVRLKEVLDRYNNRRKQPYPLSISIGQAEYKEGETLDIKDLLTQADKNMCKISQNKKGKTPNGCND